MASFNFDLYAEASVMHDYTASLPLLPPRRLAYVRRMASALARHAGPAITRACLAVAVTCAAIMLAAPAGSLAMLAGLARL